MTLIHCNEPAQQVFNNTLEVMSKRELFGSRDVLFIVSHPSDLFIVFLEMVYPVMFRPYSRPFFVTSLDIFIVIKNELERNYNVHGLHSRDGYISHNIQTNPKDYVHVT
jgi:hypothetical protein